MGDCVTPITRGLHELGSFRYKLVLESLLALADLAYEYRGYISWSIPMSGRSTPIRVARLSIKEKAPLNAHFRQKRGDLLRSASPARSGSRCSSAATRRFQAEADPAQTALPQSLLLDCTPPSIFWSIKRSPGKAGRFASRAQGYGKRGQQARPAEQ
jgi:hypothetical protein